jgi:hypothetical protein
MHSSVRAKLAEEIDWAPWRELKSHALDDRLLLVALELNLLDVAVGVASDSTAEVEAWMRAESIARPSAQQMAVWDDTPAMPFRCVIVAPFVLVQLPSREPSDGPRQASAA